MAKNTNWKTTIESMSTQERNEAEDGDNVIIFNKDSNTYEGWNGSSWIGFGGDSGLNNQGFIDYNDTTGSVSLTSDTWTIIPNNGEGAFSNSTYSPEGVSEFMNVSNGSIDVSDLELGDSIFIRNDFKINPNTNNALVEFRYRLGGGG